MKIVRINKGKALPLPFRFVGVLIVTVSVIKTMQSVPEPWSIFISIILSTLLPAMWFATNVIAIDMTKHQLFDGVWMMGFKIGEKITFASINKIFINKIKTKQTLYSISNKQNIIVNHEYRAYIEIESGEKFFLFSHPLKERAEEKITEIKNKLRIMHS